MPRWILVLGLVACGPRAPVASKGVDELPGPLPGRVEPITPDPARDQRIADQFGEECTLARTCGPIWGIDCGAASDGPFLYVAASNLQIISNCGGFCMIDPDHRCERECPPPAWDCKGRR